MLGMLTPALHTVPGCVQEPLECPAVQPNSYLQVAAEHRACRDSLRASNLATVPSLSFSVRTEQYVLHKKATSIGLLFR